MTEQTFSKWNWRNVIPGLLVMVIAGSSPVLSARDETRSKPGKPGRHGVVDVSELETQETRNPALRQKKKSRPDLPSRGRPRGRPVPPDDSGPSAAVTSAELESTVQAQASTLSIQPTAGETPPLTASFLGLLDSGLSGTFNPDTQGAVGPNHLMVAANTDVRIQTRDGAVLRTVTLDGFWSPIGASNVFDPRILYDPYGGRWIMSAACDPLGPNPLVLMAVSQTSDPTGQWNLYSVAISDTSARYAESPNLGFNRHWIVVQADLFNAIDFIFETSDLFVFTKSEVYAGGAGNHRTLSLNGAADVATHVPAATYDPALDTLYVMANYNGNFNGSGFLQTLAITGPIGNETVAHLAYHESTSWEDFAMADILPQQGTTRKVFAGDARVANVVYREGTLFTTHSVFAPIGAPVRSGVQWWEVSPGGRIPKQVMRLIDPANVFHYAYPSIAVNRNLDVMLGFNRFWSERYVSAYFAYRSVTDTPNTMRPITAVNLVKLGEAPYIKPNFYGNNVWGDWSATVVDPVNDTEMWTLQEYASAQVGGQSRWGTWWGRVTPDVNLTLAGTASASSITAGENVTYSLFITNQLEARVEGVRLTNTLPAGATFISATPSQGSCSHSAGQVVCDLGRMEDLTLASVAIVARPFNTGLSTNIARLSARGPDMAPADNTVSMVVQVNSSSDAGVGLAMAPNPVHVGSDLTLTATVTNAGPSTALGVMVTNLIPVTAAFVSATPSVGSFVRSGANVIWTVGNVAPGAAPNIRIVVRPTVGGTVTVQSILRLTSADPRIENNTATQAVRANALPVLSVISSRTSPEDTVTNLAFSISDAETPADALGLVVSSSNQGLVPNVNLGLTRNSGSCSLAITPVANQFGSTVITRTLTDSDGASVTLQFTLTVSAVNDPPTIDAISDVVVGEDSGARAVSLTGITGGPSNEPQAPTASAISSAPGIVPNPTVTPVSGGGATLTFTPVANAFGTAVITVNVNDGGTSNNITPRQFNVTVVGVNDAPTLNQPANLNLSEDAPLQTVNLTGISAGNANETDTLTISASADPAILRDLAVNYSSGASGTLTFNTVPQASGSSTVTLTVNDNMPSNNIITRMFTVNVSPVNDPPTIDLPADLNILEDAGVQSVPLSGITSGAANENQPLTVTPSTANPGLIANLSADYSSPNSTGTLTFNTPADANGSGSITVTVRDDGASNNVTQRSINVTVTAVNDPPTLDAIASLNVPEDSPQQRITLTGISEGAANEGAQNIAFAATSSHPSIIPDPIVLYTNGQSTASLRFTPVPDATGQATITVTATDNGDTANGGQNSIRRMFTITVDRVNDLPTITPIANRTISEDTSTTFLFQIGDDETPVAQLNVSAVSTHPVVVPPSGLALSGTTADRSLDVTPAADQFGVVTNRITVVDGESGSRTEEFVLTVSPVNDPPTINEIPPVTVNEDSGQQIVILAGLSGGPGNEPQNLTITASSSATGIIPAPAISYTNGQSTGVLRFTPVADASGLVTLTVRVNDGGSSNNITQRTFDVDVREINDAPTISGIADQTMVEDGLLTVPFTIGDRETPLASLNLSAQSFNEEVIASADLSFGGSGSNPTVIVRPLPEQSGAAFIVVTVTDQQGVSATATFEVTVTPVNDAPVISPISNQSMDQDTTLTVFFTVSDAEGDSFTVSAASPNTTLLPPGSLILGQTTSNRFLRIIPASGQSGGATVNITAGDGQSNSVRQFTLTVIDFDDPPTISGFNAVTINEDTATTALPFTIGDVDTPLASLSLSGGSSNPGLVSASSFTFGGSGASRTVVVRPLANQSGTARVTIYVRDSSGGASNSFLLTVVAVNDPPTLSAIGNQSTLEDTAITVAFTLADIDTLPMNVAVTGTSTNTSLVPNANIHVNGDGASRTVTIIPSPNQSGVTRITLTANDGSGPVTSAFQLTVGAVNDPPTLNPLTNRFFSINPGVITVPLSGIGSGAGNESDTLSVTVSNSNPAFFQTVPAITYSSPAATGSLSFRPANNQTGTNTITVTVNDNRGSNNIFRQSFLLAVKPNANSLPVISGLGDRSTPEDTQGTIFFSVSDVETPAASLILSAISLNQALLPNNNISFGGSGSSRSITLTPVTNASGSAPVVVSVLDGGFGGTNVSFTLTVGAVNDAPTISSIGSRSTAEDTATGPIPFTVSDAETPAGSLTVTAISDNAVLVPGGSISLGGSGANRALSITPATNLSGVANITVTVSDGTTSANSQFTLTVNAVEDLPTITPIPDQAIAEDSATLALPFTIGDAETQVGALQLSASSSDSILVPLSGISFGGAGANRTVTVTPAPNRFGSATINLHVTDGAGMVSTASFTLVVSAVNDAPVFNDIPDMFVPMNSGQQLVAVQGIGAGGPGETQLLTLTASSSNPAIVPHPNVDYASPDDSGLLSFTPAAGATGDVTITVTLRDNGSTANGGQNATTQTFVVRVGALVPPSLQIAKDGGNVMVSWPAAAGDYVLQVASSVTGLWTDVTTAPTVVDGRNVITQAGNQTARFYRLRLRSQGGSDVALQVNRDADAIILSWPIEASNYVLEATADAGGNQWSTVNVTPTVSEERYVVSQPMNNPARFYRLRRQ